MNLESIHSQHHGENREFGTPEIRRQIGKELRTAREVQEMSLEQVVAITKINQRNLKSIEAGVWSFLPPTYTKAFIISYATAVGAYSGKLRQQLDDLFFAAIAPVKEQLQTDSDSTATPDIPSSPGLSTLVDHNRSIILYSVLALIAIVAVIFYITRPRSTPIPLPQENRPEPTVTADTTRDTLATVIPAVEPVADQEPEAATFDLLVQAIDTCYVKIMVDDSLFYERTLWPGNRARFSPEAPVKLTLGNAPGVIIAVDGSPLPEFPPGRRMRVVMVGPEGFIR